MQDTAVDADAGLHGNNTGVHPRRIPYLPPAAYTPSSGTGAHVDGTVESCVFANIRVCHNYCT